MHSVEKLKCICIMVQEAILRPWLSNCRKVVSAEVDTDQTVAVLKVGSITAVSASSVHTR